MITYVNTVLISNNTQAPVVATKESEVTAAAGQYVILTDGAATTAGATKIKVGVKNGNKIKWSNWINKADIKSYTYTKYTASIEDAVGIDFTKMDAAVAQDIAAGGISITLRLTFKDLPTRFRNWTESYNYVSKPGDDASKIATAFENQINEQYKRARVAATTNGSTLELTALLYDDDDSNDTINEYGKVRFNATMYFTNPSMPAFASSNKYMLSSDNAFIIKTPGKTHVGEGKLVRDRESNSMGYEGILNRGMCTWPIIKPAMVADINNQYDVFTLEFENMYRAADDIFRKTKQTVELDGVHTYNAAVFNELVKFATGDANATAAEGTVIVRN